MDEFGGATVYVGYGLDIREKTDSNLSKRSIHKRSLLNGRVVRCDVLVNGAETASIKEDRIQPTKDQGLLLDARVNDAKTPPPIFFRADIVCQLTFGKVLMLTKLAITD